MKRNLLAGVLMLVAAVALGGCGYSLSPTPYGLLEPLTVSVPVATNQSRFADLGPWLTADIISRLDASWAAIWASNMVANWPCAG